MNIEISTLKYSLLFILILVLFGTIFMFLRDRSFTSRDTQQDVPHQKHLKYRLQIKGFNLSRFEGSKKVITIKADEITIKKKKLGFFRLGLIHTAVFENAIIDLYLKRKIPVDYTIPVDDTILIREELSSLKDTFASLGTKRISSIILKPVCINLRDENSLLTQITSNRAIIKSKKNILFTGDVHVVSGDKSLITEHLTFLTEKFKLKADRHFILETPGRKIEGNHITVDTSLDVIKDKTIIKPDNSTTWFFETRRGPVDLLELFT
jgi:hypothetical protein